MTRRDGVRCHGRSTFFGILVVPLGVVSISLIILQPLAVGACCTPCLLAAIAMVTMIALTLDEVVAMGQFLAQATREGQRFWRTFWLGGTLRELPTVPSVHADVVHPGAMIWGVALPWNLNGERRARSLAAVRALCACIHRNRCAHRSSHRRAGDRLRWAVLFFIAVATLGGALLAINLHLWNAGSHPWLIPKDGFDEGVDLDRVLPALQLVIAWISIVVLRRLGRTSVSSSRLKHRSRIVGEV